MDICVGCKVAVTVVAFKADEPAVSSEARMMVHNNRYIEILFMADLLAK
jgi:hypothetical protein